MNDSYIWQWVTLGIYMKLNVKHFKTWPSSYKIHIRNKVLQISTYLLNAFQSKCTKQGRPGGSPNNRKMFLDKQKCVVQMI